MATNHHLLSRTERDNITPRFMDTSDIPAGWFIEPASSDRSDHFLRECDRGRTGLVVSISTVPASVTNADHPGGYGVAVAKGRSCAMVGGGCLDGTFPTPESAAAYAREVMANIDTLARDPDVTTATDLEPGYDVYWDSSVRHVLDVGDHLSDVDGVHVKFRGVTSHEDDPTIHERLIDMWLAEEPRFYALR